MGQHTSSTHTVLEIVLLGLQTFQVIFLWVHDWIPLGRLNDVAAVRSQDTLRRLVIVTLIQSLPWSIGLFFSARYFGETYPAWLDWWLWISYWLLFIGQMRAWWAHADRDVTRKEPRDASTTENGGEPEARQESYFGAAIRKTNPSMRYWTFPSPTGTSCAFPAPPS
jgi:hypothetical protein